MTLKRLAIFLAILIFLAGVGIAWLWQYAYTPEGRARVIIAQLKGESDTTLRGWLLRHHVIRPGFAEPPDEPSIFVKDPGIPAATDEMIRLGHDVLPIVIEALEDSNDDVQKMAVRACRKFRDPIAIEPLVKCVTVATQRNAIGAGSLFFDTYVQSLCLDSLAKIGPKAYPKLLEASKEIGPAAQEELPVILAGNWGPEAIPLIIELLEDSDPVARLHAAKELGKFRDKRATDALIRHLSDPETFIRPSAATALGEIGDPRAIPSLLKALDDEQCRCEAAGALARLGRDDGLKYLVASLRQLEHTISEGSLLDVVEALCTNKIKGTFEPLLELITVNDPNALIDPSARLHAVRFIGRFHDLRAIPVLKNLMMDSDPEVRKAAAESLKELGVMSPPASQPGKP